MTWPPQSPVLNPIEMVWDELDHRVKKKQLTSAQHMWELLQNCWKRIPGEAGWENIKSVQSCHQGKGWLLWRIWNLKYILICLCHALTLVIFVFFSIWLGQGVTRVVCLVVVLSRVFCMSRGFSSLGVYVYGCLDWFWQLFIVVSDWEPYLGSHIPWLFCGLLFYV